ncbi:hypothetical protein, partial [Actinomycetospora succinea]|uniref:hypothetical protein n=1 Tax=Actinomycetospora succinea TaxID=663603 RepID=UPI003CD05A99
MSGIVGGDTRVGTPRRTVLQGAAAVVAVTGLAAAGCARDEGPDELEAPLAAARADMATAAAAGAAFGGVQLRAAAQ